MRPPVANQLSKTIGVMGWAAQSLLTLALVAWPAAGLALDAASPAAARYAELGAPGRSAPAPRPAAVQPKRADFLGEPASPEARRVADWAVSSGDHGALPFVVIDKIHAKVFVFDSDGRLRGASLALLGKARGDDTFPGVGSQPLSTIRPEERTTPAGRFVAFLGHDLTADILWIDYDAALSLHRVVKGNPGDHRSARLATSSALDKRISYGCVNVPANFYDDVVLKAFVGSKGIVYILPEIKKLGDVFAMSEVPARIASTDGRDPASVSPVALRSHQLLAQADAGR